MKHLVLILSILVSATVNADDYMSRARAATDAHWANVRAQRQASNERRRAEMLAEMRAVGGTDSREETWSDGDPRYLYFSIGDYKCSIYGGKFPSCYDGNNVRYDVVRTGRGGVKFVKSARY